jgi:hypothetical protein
MKYEDKTKEQLRNESAKLHQYIEALKAGETKHSPARSLLVMPAMFDHRRSPFIRDNNIR